MSDFVITAFNGRGDGQFDNSSAFQAASAAIKTAGGGTLCVPAGVWRTGPIELVSHTTFILDEGAVISFIPEVSRYTPVYTRWEGVSGYGFHPLVFASGQEHITIKGSGVFDGAGETWWKMHREKKQRGQRQPETPEEKELAGLNAGFGEQPSGGGGRATQFLRPPLMQFINCANITLDGFSVRNSPFWNVHPVFCDTLTIRNINISAPKDAPNTDGIDIDSCEHVLIEHCTIAVGDDGIALKSGSGDDGIRINKPTAHVTVRHCTVKDAHGGIVIGSETAGGIFDITAEQCAFLGADRGIRIKTRRGRGGHIHDLVFRDLIMEHNLCPIAINMFYRCGADSCAELFRQDILPLTSTTPSIKNIRVENVHATDCRASAGFVAGLPEAPVEDLAVNNCVFVTDEASAVSPDISDMFLGVPPVSQKSFRLLNVKNESFSNVIITGPEEAFIRG